MDVETPTDDEPKSIIYERQGHFSSLDVIRAKGDLCDVTVDVEDKSFPAHRIILAATINYFQKLFLNSDEQTNTNVTVEDVSAKSMKAFLSFAYTGSIVITEKNAQTLMIDAEHLGLDDVSEQCVNFFHTCLRSNNVSQMYSFAEARGIESLKEKCKKFIATHFEDISKTDEFLYFDFELLKDVLSSHEVHEDLELIFDAVIRWITTNLDQRHIYTTELLSYARLSNLPAQTVIDYFSKDPTLAENNSDFVSEIVSLYETFEKVAFISEKEPTDAEEDAEGDAEEDAEGDAEEDADEDAEDS